MSLLHLLTLSLLLFSIHTRSSSTCKPFQCGDYSFSYPFSVYDENTLKHCGLPGLLISCEDDIPILHMKSERYKVLDINYVNRTVTLVDTDILDQNTSCPRVQNNVSFFMDSGVTFTQSTDFIFFFFGCNLPNPKNYTSVPCLTNAESGNAYLYSFYMDFNLSHYDNLTTRCQSVVEVPVLVNLLLEQDNEFSNVSTAFMLLRHGFELSWDFNLTNDCIQCEQNNGLCGYILTSDTSFYKFDCICPNGSCNRKRQVARVIGACSISGVLAFCIGFLYYASKNKMLCFSIKARKLEKLVQVNLENFGSLSPKRYTFSEIRRITKSYNQKIGQGGYASVFKGVLMDGTPVAVKLFKDRESTGEEFTSEVVSIARTSHVNIVRLLGFSIKGSKRALIYEFVQNGSLDKCLRENQNSTLSHVECTRLFEIAVGISQGLKYLHGGCNTRIIHFDIKPHNILLVQEYCPKISDFGLAKFCQPKESILSMSGLRGTIGYIAPEVFSRKFGAVSSKSDVYSYGMMVLEMFGGKQAKMELINSSSDTYFHDCIYKWIEQNNISSIYGVTDGSEEIVRKVMIIGLWCIQMLPHARPTMSAVLDMLDKNIEELALPPLLNVSLSPVVIDEATKSTCTPSIS